jgi:hypothetical protein
LSIRARLAAVALVLIASLAPTAAGADHVTTLRIAAVGPDYVDLAWTAPDGALRYDVMVSGNGGASWVTTAKVPYDQPKQWRVTELWPATWHFKVVAVFWGSRHGNTSNIVSTPVPANLCAIAPADGEVAIQAAIAGCADGSLVRFPANQQYHQAHKIQVADRHGLVIDLNGSTFTNSTNGTVTQAVDGNFVVLRGTNITIRNGTLIGDFTAYEGQERSLAVLANDPELTQAAMGVGLYGVVGATVEDLTILNQWTDGVTLGPDGYVDGSDLDYARDVYIRRINVDTVGRMCFAPTSGINVWIEDSACSDAWYGGIDAEQDAPDQPIIGHHYLRNTFDGYRNFAIAAPAAGVDTADIEIRGNEALSIPDMECFATIQIGYWPDNTELYDNVVVDGNVLRHFGSAVFFDNVNGGAITNNQFIRTYPPDVQTSPEIYCGDPFDNPIRITDSVNVTVSGNTES